MAFNNALNSPPSNPLQVKSKRLEDENKDINLQVGGDASMEGVALGDRNKIINRVAEIHGHVVQADNSQVHIGDVYYYFEIPKNEVIEKEPYKFLSTYEISDEDIFFGRKRAIQELSSQILSHKLVLLNGKSGSGKSSLIYAGLTPRFLRNNYLVIHIKDYIKSPSETVKDAVTSDIESPLLIFLDQFERFFIYLSSDEQDKFVMDFKNWLDDKTLKVRFVVCIRMDFFGRIGEFQKVIRDIYQQSYIFTLEALSREEAKEAIEGPLENRPVVYNPKFVEEVMLNQLLRHGEIEPAQLQIVCDKLYRKTKEINLRIIDETIYKQLNGVKGILKTYLREKLEEYKPEDEMAKSILKQMIAPSELDSGIRTFVEIPEIAKTLKLSEEKVHGVVDRLVNDRLVEKKEVEQKGTFSLIHEYMVNQVKEWYDPHEIAVKRARDILSHAMMQWRIDKVLMDYKQASQVQQYQDQLKLNDEERSLLKGSLKKHYRWLWIRRGIVTTITLFAVIVSFLGYYTYKQKKETAQQLVRTLLTHGISARDLNNEPLKASHYFIKAAEITDDPILSKNAQLASEMLSNNIRLNSIIDSESKIEDLKVSQDRSRFLVRTTDGIAKILSVKGNEIHKIILKEEVDIAEFIHEGSQILTWNGSDETFKVWDTENGKLIKSLMKLSTHLSITDKSLNNLRSEGVPDDVIRVLKKYLHGILWKDGKELLDYLKRKIGLERTVKYKTSILKHSKRILSDIKFSPDGSRILTWIDGMARILDSKNGESLINVEIDRNLISEAVFNHDGSRILTWIDAPSQLQTFFQIWDGNSGESVTSPLKTKDYCYQGPSLKKGGVFSQDSRRILIWCNNTAQLWNIEGRGSLIHSLGHGSLEHDGFVSGAALNQDGSRILTWSIDGTVKLWDSKNGSLLITLTHSGEVWGAGFNQDETKILTWSKDGTAKLWDSKNGSLLIPPLKHADGVRAAIFNQDESKILTFTIDKIKLWEISNIVSLVRPLKNNSKVGEADHFGDRNKKDFTNDTLYIFGARRLYSPDKSRILTLSKDEKAKLWDSATGKLLRDLGHISFKEFPLAKFNQDGSRILTLSEDGIARLWDTSSGKLLIPPLRHEGLMSSDSLQGAEFNEKGNMILTWGSYIAWLWDIGSNEPFNKVIPDKLDSQIMRASFSQDESQIVIWDMHAARIQMWNIENQETDIRQLHNSDRFFRSKLITNYTNNRSYILTFDDKDLNGTCRLWDITGHALTQPLNGDGLMSITGAVFNQYESQALTWSAYSADTIARLWDSKNGSLLIPPLKHDDEVLGAIFNQDESQILTWSRDKMVRLWDSKNGSLLIPPLKHDDEVLGAIFNQDESQILTWSKDKMVRLWDSTSGVLLASSKQKHYVVEAAFSQDESQILIWSWDGIVRLWNLGVGYDFPRDHLALKLEVQTGTKMNELGELEPLSSEEWREKKQKYERIKALW